MTVSMQTDYSHKQKVIQINPIYTSDLKIFIDKYMKEKKSYFSTIKIAPEIYLIRVIHEKYNGKNVILSDDDKNTLIKMFEQNLSERRGYKRNRDRIIDNMILYFGLKPGYLSFKDLA